MTGATHLAGRTTHDGRSRGPGKLQSAAQQADPSFAVQCGGLRALSALESEARGPELP